jgi:hypothetical protein
VQLSPQKNWERIPEVGLLHRQRVKRCLVPLRFGRSASGLFWGAMEVVALDWPPERGKEQISSIYLICFRQRKMCRLKTKI